MINVQIVGYGVMVTLQILVLSFLVRIRVSQRVAKYDDTWPLFLYLCCADMADSLPFLSC